MAKTKRPPSSKQRDERILDDVRYLKRVGIISPKAKIHHSKKYGTYVSRSVARKAQEYLNFSMANYTTVKASRDAARKAKENGLTVVRGNRVVVPRDSSGHADRRYRRAISEGRAAGVQPVKYGTFEIVTLSDDLMDVFKLVEAQENGEINLDDLKNPGEMFTFRLFGNQAYQAFRNLGEMTEYLKHYKSLFTAAGSPRLKDRGDMAESLVIYRLNPADQALIPGREERARIYRGRNDTRQDRRGRPIKYVGRDAMHPTKLRRVRDADRTKHEKSRANWTPEKRAEENRKAKERMQRKRDRDKNT